MGEHRTFGGAGGPRRVGDQRDVIGCRVVEHDRPGPCRAALRRLGAVRWHGALHHIELGGDDDDVPSARGARHDDGAGGVVHDRNRGPDVADDVRELAFGVGGVHRDDHQAGAQGGDVAHRGGHRRPRAPQHAVATAEAQVRQRPGPGPRRLVELGGTGPPGSGGTRGAGRRRVEEKRCGRRRGPRLGPGAGRLRRTVRSSTRRSAPAAADGRARAAGPRRTTVAPVAVPAPRTLRRNRDRVHTIGTAILIGIDGAGGGRDEDRGRVMGTPGTDVSAVHEGQRRVASFPDIHWDREWYEPYRAPAAARDDVGRASSRCSSTTRPTPGSSSTGRWR